MAMTVPSVPVIPVGAVVTSAQMNQMAYCCTFLLGKPATRVYDNASDAVLVPNSGAVVIFTTADFDSDGCWNSGSPDRLTIQTPGYYKARYGVNTGGITLSAGLLITTGANNPLGAGTSNYAWPAGTFGRTDAQATGGGVIPYYMYAGDYVQVAANPNATATQSTNNEASWLEIEYVSV